MLEKLGILQPSNEDIKRMIAGKVHLGAKQLTHAMSDYVTNKSNARGDVFILNLAKFWDKLILAARVIVAIEEPKDVCVISARPAGKRAVIKYAQYTEASQLPDRFTPGTFTNQKQERVFMEPRVLILTDPNMDSQALVESSYVNIPVIALCNTDSYLDYVDIAIPCNNRSKESIALIYWFLARTVRRMRGQLGHSEDWEVAVDLFYQRDLDEIKEEEEVEEEIPYAGMDQMGQVGATDPTMQAAVDPNAQAVGAGADDWADAGDWADEQYAQTNWDPNTQQGAGAQAMGQQTAGMVDPNQQQYDPNQQQYVYDPNSAPQYAQVPQQTYDNQQYAQPQAQQYAQVDTNTPGQVHFPDVDVEQW